MSRTQDFFTISDLAREFGITPRTIRYLSSEVADWLTGDTAD